MDNEYTAPFLGYAGLPSGLHENFFHTSLSVFSEIADKVGRHKLHKLARDEAFGVRLGLARVIDFAVLATRLKTG